MSAPPKTVYQRIADDIKARLTSMPADSGNGRFWNGIFEGPVAGKDNTTYPCVGVDFGTEEVIAQMWPLVQKNVQVFIEFRFRGTVGKRTHQEVYRDIIGRLQTTFLGTEEKQTLGGLVNAVFETGANPEIEGDTDPGPGGVLMLTVQYEHINGNPYKSRGDLADGDYQSF